MPYFAQEPLSYLTLPTIKNAYKAFNIKINFRPDNVDGKEVQSSQCSIILFTFCNSFSVCCIFLMHNVTASSVPSLPPSVTSVSHHWWEGLILYAGESQCLRTAGAQA